MTKLRKIVQYIINSCYNLSKKGSDENMYGLETYVGKEFFSDTFDVKEKEKRLIRNTWHEYKILRNMAKNSKFDNLITEFITTDKAINSGKSIVVGTRISTSDIMRMIFDGYSPNEILENLSNISDEKQILAAIIYEIRNTHFFKFFIKEYIRR